VKTPARILQLLTKNSKMILVEVAKAIDKSPSAVERAASKLVRTGHLRHIGLQKGGHWEVLK